MNDANFITCEEREKIYKWIMEKVVDKSFEKKLRMVKCVKCNFENFEVKYIR